MKYRYIIIFQDLECKMVIQRVLKILVFYTLIVCHFVITISAENYKWVPYCQEGEFKLQRGACTIKNYEKQVVPYDRISKNETQNQTLDFANRTPYPSRCFRIALVL